MGDLDELKKLSPEDRVKKLREIEEKNRKEIEEAQKLMTESLRQIEVEDEIRRDIPIPQLTSVDVDSLFGKEEKDMFKTKRFGEGYQRRDEAPKEESLEESIAKENPKDLPPEVIQQYTQKLEDMSSRVQELQNMDSEHFHKYQNEYNEELSQMYDNLEKMQKYESLKNEIESMSLSDQIGKMIGGYKRGGV